MEAELRDVQRITRKAASGPAEEPHDDRAARRANRLRAGVLGQAGARRATLRVVLGGALAMAVTYAVGLAVGTAI